MPCVRLFVWWLPSGGSRKISWTKGSGSAINRRRWARASSLTWNLVSPKLSRTPEYVMSPSRRGFRGCRVLNPFDPPWFQALELARRRRATKISKHVTQFWTKIDKLVVYKHRSQLEAKRREALDRHLSFLVAQTEKYSSTIVTPEQAVGAIGVRVSVLLASLFCFWKALSMIVPLLGPRRMEDTRPLSDVPNAPIARVSARRH